ncbi:NAD(P)-dependent oxidoreductase [Maliponia aquimaris]|uniref:Phosphogluconate dehydrogenase NAD-binding putative C-terminal domain-containing protein n=1 Tax=Maliponia aquimaris TaxID=1673631 RepID=A0A238KQN3_9RHOB|nr:DUF1932 domain-containing protein [Maliponia aquimaris]SMX45038.1 hypothetical protein MAA8898_03127 [Maliponia aquimaris]
MRMAFIGLGEAAGAILSGWGPEQVRGVRTFDIKSEAPETAGEIAERAARLGVTACAKRAEALEGAEVVFCTVTADQAGAAASACAPLLAPGALWCDLNSCAPQTKVASAGIITAAGARYLDVAVMAPVYPKRNMVPCLLSGPEAAEVAPLLADLPMAVRVVGDAVGRASSVKMVRSVLVKGMEALTAECVLAAVLAGVEEEVFPSMKTAHPNMDVPARAAYNFERTLVHGQRRAAEMDEVAKMLAGMGLPNVLSVATAEWQRKLSSSGVTLQEGEEPDHRWFAEAYLRSWGLR